MKKILISLAIFTISLVGLKLSANTTYTPGSLLKPQNSSAVYYIGEDNKKYVFPDGKTYNTWYNNFDNITTVDIATLDSYSDGGAMPYRAGTRLITHQNTAKIYAVEPNGIIRWIPTEEIATSLYGDTWYTRVQDVIPGYFSSSYTTGDSLSTILPTGTIVKNNDSYYYIEEGKRKSLANYQDYNTEDILELDNLDDYDNLDDPSSEPDLVDNDQDNDGYDSTASGGNDCNDDNPSINPGATDICGNGIDEDCSGSDLSCPLPPTPGEPSIGSLSASTLVHGQTYTISGSDFGSKEYASPLRWDNFETGINDTHISEYWDVHYNNNGQAPKYSNTQTRANSFMSIENNFDNQYRNDFGIDRDGAREYFNLYISFYSYIDLSNTLSRNFKIVRAYMGDSADSDILILTTFPSTLSDGWKFYTPNIDYTSAHYEEDVWRRYEVWVNIDPTTCNQAQFFYNNKLIAEGCYTPSNHSHGIDEVRIGHYYANDLRICTEASSSNYLNSCTCTDGTWSNPCYSDTCGGDCGFSSLGCSANGGCNASIYFDDVYIDTTRQRIELGDTPVFSDSTHREIQIPSMWNDTSISFEANLGSFSQIEIDAGLYLFIIDADGNVSDGYLVGS